jgi:hypothetical protein
MSLFDKVIARRRPWWVALITSLVLFLIPLAATALDGAWENVLSRGMWRPILLAPVVVIYVLVVSQMMAKSNADILRTFRSLLEMDEDAFDQLVRSSSRVKPAGEIIALVAGALVGLALSLAWLRDVQTFWLRLYMPVSLSLLIGLLGWTIYDSIASTGLIETLHRQPLQVDILDIKPLEPVGRYSLVVALAFVGGITLGVIFGLDVENVLAWQTWLFFLPLISVPVIVFFLNMLPTHRLLASEKKRQLETVLKKIQCLSHKLQSRIAEEKSLGKLSGEYTALIAYETRLRAAPTWPYNTAMARTLSLTIFVPLLVRGLSVLLFGQ